jgi:hypothetical protein
MSAKSDIQKWAFHTTVKSVLLSYVRKKIARQHEKTLRYAGSNDVLKFHVSL